MAASNPLRALLLVTAAAATACSAGKMSQSEIAAGASSGGSAGTAPQPDAASGSGGSGAGPSDGGGFYMDVAVGDSTPDGWDPCKATQIPDFDQDGFTTADGDCADCDPNANPGAFDVPGNGMDEDCNGVPDDTPTACDAAIVDIGYTDPMDGARAIGLCKQTGPTDRTWGVISAAYVKADGSPGMNDLSHGLLDGFGPAVHPQEGTRMLVLSSGTARIPGQTGYQPVTGAQMGTTSTTPPGYPVDSPSCNVTTSSDTNANDPAALEVKLRVPTNANSMSFNLDFYTYEFPGYVCSGFNDFFVALQTPPPPSALNGNVSFDAQGNPISVNAGFLEVCAPQTAGGKTFACARGTGELSGTGFEPSAATGWLQTVSPVEPGSEITLRFAIWDMGDHILDSTVMVDKFEFSIEPQGEAGTIPVPTPR